MWVFLKKPDYKVLYAVQFEVNDHVDARQREPQSDSTDVQELGRGLAPLTQSPLLLYLTLLYVSVLLSFRISLHFSIWNKPLLFWYFGLSPPIFERDVFCSLYLASWSLRPLFSLKWCSFLSFDISNICTLFSWASYHTFCPINPLIT